MARKFYLRISWGLIGFDFISRQMLFLVVLRRNLRFFDFEWFWFWIYSVKNSAFTTLYIVNCLKNFPLNCFLSTELNLHEKNFMSYNFQKIKTHDDSFSLPVWNCMKDIFLYQQPPRAFILFWFRNRLFLTQSDFCYFDPWFASLSSIPCRFPKCIQILHETWWKGEHIQTFFLSFSFLLQLELFPPFR